MAQQWGYQGGPAQGQGYSNYYPDSQYQQPPQFSHPQQQPHPQMYPQQQYATPPNGPQYDPYQQQYMQQQGQQQFGPQFGLPPGPQYAQQFAQQPGPQYNQQPGFPQRFPPDYQQHQQHGQYYSDGGPSVHHQPQNMYQQGPQQSFDRPPKSAVKLAKPSPPSCFNCGSPEHWAMYCPEPRRAVPAGQLARSQSQAYVQHSNGFAPRTPTTHYSPQQSPSMGQNHNGYGHGSPQYSQPTNLQSTFPHHQGAYGSSHTPIPASSPSHFSGPFQQPQPFRHPHRSSFSASSRSIPPSPATSASHGNAFQRPPLPREIGVQHSQGSPSVALSPIAWRPTSIPIQSEAKKARSISPEPSEEGEVSGRASIDQSVCMESDAEMEIDSGAATPEYEPAEPEPRQELEPEELEEDDLEQLDVPDAPKYPGAFDAIGPQPVRFALPTRFEWNCGTLDMLPRPSPGSSGFVQSGYVTKRSIVDMDHKFIDLPGYQHDANDPICLILHGDLKDALITEEPEVVDELGAENAEDDGTDRSMSCDEEEETPSQKVSVSSLKERNGIPQQQHIPPPNAFKMSTPASGIPTHAQPIHTDWETEQKLAALGVTGTPKPSRMPARPWHSAEPFRQPRHPPPPPEPMPMPVREEGRHLSPVWQQNSSARHESTAGLHETWEAPQQNGTGTPPYMPELHGDPVEDNPWVPPGGHEIHQPSDADSQMAYPVQNGHNNAHIQNGHDQNGNGHQRSPPSPADHLPVAKNGISQSPTSPTSGQFSMHQNGTTADSPGEPNPVWKSNAPIRTSLKDRFAKINSRKREFEPENPSDEDRGKERKRQEDDVTPRLKRRQPKVAEAYSRRW